MVESIKVIANIGTGTMGFGTAMLFAVAGYDVRMYGRSSESVTRGMNSIASGLDMFAQHELISPQQIAPIMSRIKAVTSLEEAGKGADFVIESVAEDLAVKKDIFSRLEKICFPHTTFATNTSGLSPTAIAEALEHPERFVVCHFWNPPHLIPLVEVVPGLQTSDQTVKLSWELMKKIGKKPVALKKEALGFIGNRLQLALLREALYIVEQGIATPEAVDTTVKYSFGRRLGVTGPLESADLGGLDIFQNISAYLFPDLCAEAGAMKSLSETVKKGNLGAKTGKGFYEWTPETLGALKKKRETVLVDWLRKDRT